MAEALAHPNHRLVYQSRSGSPSQPWLSPDILEAIEEEYSCGAKDLVLVPIGFVSDHVEIIFDLDTQARERCQELGYHLPARPHRRNPSPVCGDDSRIDRRAHHRVTAPSRARLLRSEPRRLPRRLLPCAGAIVRHPPESLNELGRKGPQSSTGTHTAVAKRTFRG